MRSVFLRSSLIASAAYDNFKLLIQFHNGTAYVYYDVAYAVFDGLVHSESPGKYYNEHIKGRYRRTRSL